MSSRYQAVLTPAANVVPQPISWLWDKWIARGKISILAGAGGCGKTTLALSLAAINSIGAACHMGQTKMAQFHQVVGKRGLCSEVDQTIFHDASPFPTQKQIFCAREVRQKAIFPEGNSHPMS